MKIYRLKKSQKLPITIDEAWAFFSNPVNLKTITPDYMGFNIVNPEKSKMYSGQIIKYKVSPLFNIKMNWVTEISHVKENKLFVDEQRFGPYKFWHHKHIFEEINNGIEAIDVLDYVVPFGFIGQIFHPYLVQPKLEEIFDYRKNKLEEIFGQYHD
jgi:ligand-binding SRPBCC domain-containing protein